MIRRALLIIAAALAVIVASGAALLTGGQLAQTLNWLLPNDWRVAIPEQLNADWHKVTLPQFSLSYQHCPLLVADNFGVQWLDEQRISLTKAILDYHCLTLLPSSENSDSSPDSLKAILALIPDGEAAVEQLVWTNLPDSLNPRLKQLLESPSEVRFAKNSQKLTAYLKQQAVTFSGNFANAQLTGELHYQPTAQERHQLQIEAAIADEIFRLPANLKAAYQWDFLENSPQKAEAEAWQQGNATLHWQTNSAGNLQGELSAQSQLQPDNQLQFPFTFDRQSLAVEQGKFAWALSNDFALRGFFTGKITPNSFQPDQLFPIKTALRLSLLSENAKGKGNVVLNSPEGEWRAADFQLPFNVHGNVKQGNFILYSAVPLDLSGEYHNPTLRFLPTALLRVTGKERFLTIDDLRFPLAGIRIDKHGIDGRLQAIFRGESPDFKQIELHLDGYANDFKAGAGDFFADAEPKVANGDRWQWRFWGNSQFQPLKTKLLLAGRGHWQQQLVQLSEFNGELGKIVQDGVQIPHISLNLSEPIVYAYAKNLLKGGLKLDAPKAAFRYGGELEKPQAALQFTGALENLNLKGEVSSGKLGPIRLFARRTLNNEMSNMLGRLYWQEQPANVFQSLFPFRSNWVITNGTIRGETAFSANAKTGLVAGGHFAIRNGALSLPSGDLKGIEFSLPYQLKNNQLALGQKKAVEVRIAELNLGVPLRNAKMQVRGHLPYSAKRPLFLRELSVELLGGELNVERFALPQREVAYLNLRNIHLEQILALAQYHQLDLRGQINATLPFWLSGKPCYICDGSFAQAVTSQLKFTPALLEAMKKSGYTEQILTYLVNDSHIDSLFGNVELGSHGEMLLTSSLQMHLAEHQKARINLNYRHQENMFELWKLINYGSQFEQNIEHSIYQKLDNR